GLSTTTSSPSSICLTLARSLTSRLVLAKRNIDRPVAPSNPTYSALSLMPFGPITSRSGEPNIPPLNGNVDGTVLGADGATGALPAFTCGGKPGEKTDGPNSTSASGNHATIVRPSSSAKPAMMFVWTSSVRLKASSNPAIASTG